MPQIPGVRSTDVDPEAYLLDVREDDEWLAGHAPGAVHLPMMQIPARLDEVPGDRDVIVVCRSGHRSAQVTGFLLAQGYDNVRNLADGMQGWAFAGRDVITEDGTAGEVI